MIELSVPQHILKRQIQLPGSKSISNRLLILNEILKLDLNFEGLSDAEDTQLLKKALRHLKGKKEATIDIHHAGTDMRFLTAYLSVNEGEWILTGSERMKQRPIGELVSALRLLGADITFTEKKKFPPLLIRGKKLLGGKIEIDSSVSSQFISALLLIAPEFENGLEVALRGNTVSKPYIDMTIALLSDFGVKISQSENIISIPSSLKNNPTPSFRIETDWSSASYWYSICALSENSEIELMGLKKESLQADSVLPEIFKNLGVNTTFKDNSVLLNSIKPVLTEFTYDFTNCPDIAQTLVVTCFGLGIKSDFTGLSTLKVKETDRIFALRTELEKFGAKLETTSNSIHLTAASVQNKKSGPSDNIIRTYNDHRMAMSFAPIALIYRTIKIETPSVVIKSYPSFWEDLKSVGFNVNLLP